MAHGDDSGLIVPPKVAPIQVVVVPIFRDADSRAKVESFIDGWAPELKAAGIRHRVDWRDERPGDKYAHWELKGVPLRLNVGGRDADARPGRDGRPAVAREAPACRSRASERRLARRARRLSRRGCSSVPTSSSGRTRSSCRRSTRWSRTSRARQASSGRPGVATPSGGARQGRGGRRDDPHDRRPRKPRASASCAAAGKVPGGAGEGLLDTREPAAGATSANAPVAGLRRSADRVLERPDRRRVRVHRLLRDHG